VPGFEERFPDVPARCVVTISTELSRLRLYKDNDVSFGTEVQDTWHSRQKCYFFLFELFFFPLDHNSHTEFVVRSIGTAELTVV
jgi:hypothetical protein